MSDDLVKMARLAQHDERMSTSALYGDLADRIAELEAETERLKRQYDEVISERPYIVGWNDGYDYAEHGDETRDVPDVVEVLVAKRIEELEVKLEKAQALAAAVDRRMNDLGGYDNRIDLRKALQEYRGTTLAELKGGKDE